MRIAGYIRERPPAAGGEPAFAQAERIRRYAADHAHDLVTLCQDAAGPGRTDETAGFRALLAVVQSGAVETVVVASLDVLGVDAETQEVMAWELRRLGAEVISTRQADQALLAADTPDGTRRTARRVLERVDEVARRVTG
jgi:DNA invertase Pin-like site-specific DNA recombinase